MDDDWITSPAGARVLQHAEDPRPAWLWSADGLHLIWHNRAATLFGAKLKKSGIKRGPTPVPIKGQIARNIRLGSTGRSSLARIQFLAGEKPISATCATTPLLDGVGAAMLLIVAVDAIDAEILLASGPAPALAPADSLAAPSAMAVTSEPAAPPTTIDSETSPDPVTESLELSVVAPELEAALVEAQEPQLPAAESQGPVLPPRPWLPLPPPGVVLETAPFRPVALVDEDEETVEPDPQVGELAPIAAAIEANDAAYQRELDNWRATESDAAAPSGYEAEDEDSAAETSEAVSEFENEPEVTPSDASEPPVEEAPGVGTRLSALVDRLSADADLFSPLTDSDDPLQSDPVVTGAAPQLWLVTGTGFVAAASAPAAEDQQDTPATIEVEASAAPMEQPTAAFIDEPEPEVDEDEDNAQEQLLASTAEDELAEFDGDDTPEPQSDAATEDGPEILPRGAPDPEAVERVSRYNFDELSRILNDRMGETSGQAQRAVAQPPSSSGALINLGGETLVLNRLPLGILVFRDQQVLFANRAITEMVGYDSVENLRAAGLASVFPAAGPEGHEAGPVNHLVQRDGTLVPVTARLQSISWQGRPALMLSASATEVRTGHEAAVRAFAETFASLRGDGFFETNRAGVLSVVSPRAAALLGQEGASLQGRPLTSFVARADTPDLQSFLERPARFAESARPCLSLRAASAGAELMLFAQGQAGVVTGYFGFVHQRETSQPRLGAPSDIDPALLARISRGIRRPLNTIIGFSDLLRSEAFGRLGTERHETYAQDIVTAGNEIAALVDELDDFTRLRDGRYLPQRASIDLTGLLESCVLRIRHQAGISRVIVRNAISESLPKVTADRASLAQAVLNLLASAIDQTPAGGAVIISSNREDDGSIAIHVRDSSNTAVDMAERFVVFRDGVGRDGKAVAPVRSSVGLALTRSLLSVNAFSLAVDPAGEHGLLFTLRIPSDLVDAPIAEAGEK
ncbi:histidine kinase dimerization/phospho-acceptor domain-containing protein [Devosia sp. 1566]|uniref:histidine kinase dimerization/phospho-acceptor domain-containing protein n=1 Tax=Devosia sp. 1566 TaxID=2499144 RepID=UPI000FD9D48A|nr:histidine kinase dimerization/phospho-acceptor domain-containing protein [Devosia sp. 1566]